MTARNLAVEPGHVASSPPARALVTAVALVVPWAISCQEESLQEVHPSVSICPAESATRDQCDRPVDLGQVPVTVPTPLTLFVREVGGARLELTKVGSSDPALVVGDHADEVFAGRQVPLPLTVELPADALGPRTFTLDVASSDPDRPHHTLELLVEGVPKPAPDVIVCLLDDPEEVCGTDLDVSFGTVRRTQAEGLALVVKNLGTAPLAIEEVRLEGETSAADEIVVATSTRPARLDAGDAAPLVVVYTPADGESDAVTLVLVTDDPETPEARVRLTGESEDNLPPVADAFETLSQSNVATAVVDDVVQVDASRSLDPEGDPLGYSWSLVAPAGSRAALDDPNAVRASFVPDIAGTYGVTLVVRDSLGQESPPAAVDVTARARFGFRAQASWLDGGDVDLHILEAGAALFGPRDCGFQARVVDFGVPGASEDDCELLDDAAAPPGPEQAVMPVPAAGTYEIWAHLFDDGGLGAIEVTMRVILDDEAAPAMLQVRQLPGDCATWHVADITFPSGAITVLDSSIGTQCP